MTAPTNNPTMMDITITDNIHPSKDTDNPSHHTKNKKNLLTKIPNKKMKKSMRNKQMTPKMTRP